MHHSTRDQLDERVADIEAGGGRACFYIDHAPNGAPMVEAADCLGVVEHNASLEVELNKVLGMTDPHYHQQIKAADQIVHPRVQVLDRDEAINLVANKIADNATTTEITTTYR